MPKSANSEDSDDIFPFTAAERDTIIGAIEADRFCPKKSAYKDNFYTPIVKFLFSTGCRPSEAAALQWKQISSDCKTITFYQAVMNTYTGRRIREGLKTQERRTFPCNRPLQALLQSIRPEGVSPNDLVFPSRKERKPMDLNNLRNRAWKRALKGLGIEYRKLYQTRHTFITLALEAGMDAKDVARLVGNSPEVIYRHYAGKKRDLSVPEF